MITQDFVSDRAVRVMNPADVSYGEKNVHVRPCLMTFTPNYNGRLAITYPEGDPADGDILVTVTFHVPAKERGENRLRAVAKRLWGTK